ncbi:MAG: glycosyltransferase family 39 protein [Chloroflexota bacterium]|nr:glycosyltransferase family 39 protein [Chloroflexota bacterium]
MFTASDLSQRYSKHIPLLVALLLAAPIIFFQAFRYSFPLGYAGMFTLIAEKIAQANFELPASIPHYGPGGIPLVYPPLGMYVFALAIKLGIPIWFYMRVIPAIFTLLAVVPLYYLTLELVESKIAGVLTVVFVITAPAVYYTHVWAAGLVRALALFFCLTGLFYYVRSLRDFSWRNFLLAGISLGLLFTTHWLYVLFAALVGLACLMAEWKPSRLPIAFGILILALLVAAPWLVLILERHGASSILLAYSSHRNADFLLSLNDIPAAVQFIRDNLRHVTDNWFLTALALPGFILLILRRNFHLPLAFIFILLMGEASFYTEILAGMLAGAFSAEIFRLTPRLAVLKSMGVSGLLKLMPAMLVILCFILSSIKGLSQIAQYQPEIDGHALRMASFLKQNTDSAATYLFIGRVNEAEWFPYLLDRTPVFAMWGSEWKGTYARQLEILVELRECQLQKSWACMEAIQQEQSVSPTLLVGPNSRWLMQQIKDTRAWDLIYTDELYLVWQRSSQYNLSYSPNKPFCAATATAAARESTLNFW